LAPALARPRAAIVASGSELVRGDRNDRNGPFLAAALLRLGIDPVRITVVGDDPAELEAALRDGLGHDLLCISGGLGPTHDDRTIELLANAAGVGLAVDPGLEAEIERITRAFSERMRRPYVHDGVEKQATLPAGASHVGVVGTAPGVVLDTGSCVAVALPGPPRELQALWPRVVETEAFQRVLARASRTERRVMRFFGLSESALAKALADAGGDGGGVTVTICAREFELVADLFVEPGAESRAAEIEAAFAEAGGPFLFSREEGSTPGLVVQLLRERGLTLATAESCTGGLVAARLTDVPGASAVFVGSVVAYADQVKGDALGVPQATLDAFGAVSAETAAAMAEGARSRLGADVAVSVTGVAGPDGGTPEKPVGLVFLHAAGPMGEKTMRLDLPGDRDTVRTRATVAALHLIRRLVTES
jgi:nicotinamide-nucleotide amidase